MRQRQHEKLAIGKLQKIVERQMTFALEGPLSALALGQQLTQPAVSGAVTRIDQNIRRTVDENDPRSDQKSWLVLDLGIFEFFVSPHHASERVVVGDADGRKTENGRLMNIGLRGRAAAQAREIRRDADFRVIYRHANSPCMNQFGCTGLPSCCSISRS